MSQDPSPTTPASSDAAPTRITVRLGAFETSALAAMCAKSGMGQNDMVCMAIRKAYYEWHRHEFETPSPEELAHMKEVMGHVEKAQAEKARLEAEFRSRKPLTEAEYNARKEAADEELAKRGPLPF